MSTKRTFYSTTEAAQEVGMSTGRVRQMLLDGQVNGFKYSNGWMIPAADVERLKRKPRPGTGRPRLGDAD